MVNLYLRGQNKLNQKTGMTYMLWRNDVVWPDIIYSCSLYLMMSSFMKWRNSDLVSFDCKKTNEVKWWFVSEAMWSVLLQQNKPFPSFLFCIGPSFLPAPAELFVCSHAGLLCNDMLCYLKAAKFVCVPLIVFDFLVHSDKFSLSVCCCVRHHQWNKVI